jgi:hypothetical protein
MDETQSNVNTKLSIKLFLQSLKILENSQKLGNDIISNVKNLWGKVEDPITKFLSGSKDIVEFTAKFCLIFAEYGVDFYTLQAETVLHLFIGTLKTAKNLTFGLGMDGLSILDDNYESRFIKELTSIWPTLHTGVINYAKNVFNVVDTFHTNINNNTPETVTSIMGKTSEIANNITKKTSEIATNLTAETLEKLSKLLECLGTKLHEMSRSIKSRNDQDEGAEMAGTNQFDAAVIIQPQITTEKIQEQGRTST